MRENIQKTNHQTTGGTEMTNSNDLAFPCNEEKQGRHGEDYSDFHGGLTKREYFASKALLGILSSGTSLHMATIPLLSVQMADALIEALNKDEEEK